MGVLKTKGIVLAQHNMSDDDAMITILTPNLGKIGCAEKTQKCTNGWHPIFMFWRFYHLQGN